MFSSIYSSGGGGGGSSSSSRRSIHNRRSQSGQSGQSGQNYLRQHDRRSYLRQHDRRNRREERYGKIGQTGVCATTECCCSCEVFSAVEMAKTIGYDMKKLESIPMEDKTNGRIITTLVVRATR
jgi:hypothetical protein